MLRLIRMSSDYYLSCVVRWGSAPSKYILGHRLDERVGVTVLLPPSPPPPTHEPHACVAVASLVIATVRARAARVVAAPRVLARPRSCPVPRVKPTTAFDQRGLQATGSSDQGACDAAAAGPARGGAVRLGRTTRSNARRRARLTTDRRHAVRRRASRRLTPPALSDCGPAITQRATDTNGAAWQHVCHVRRLALRCRILSDRPACGHERAC